MKLRVKGNSLRLRLTKLEVEQMAMEGCVKERTSFGSNELVYMLQQTGEQTLSASFKANTITVFIPASFLHHWKQTDIITFSGTMPLGNNETLELLVEKDFKCLDNTDEDQSDNFENPNKVC